jgi:hypothetical protein
MYICIISRDLWKSESISTIMCFQWRVQVYVVMCESPESVIVWFVWALCKYGCSFGHVCTRYYWRSFFKGRLARGLIIVKFRKICLFLNKYDVDICLKEFKHHLIFVHVFEIYTITLTELLRKSVYIVLSYPSYIFVWCPLIIGNWMSWKCYLCSITLDVIFGS